MPDSLPAAERLRRVLEAHALSYGAVIDSVGEVFAQVGDLDAFDSAGLVTALLGPYGSAKETYDAVQQPDRIRPVIWKQGSEFAFLDCAGKLVVVVFGRDRVDALAQYQFSVVVGKSIAAEFADVS